MIWELWRIKWRGETGIRALFSKDEGAGGAQRPWASLEWGAGVFLPPPSGRKVMGPLYGAIFGLCGGAAF